MNDGVIILEHVYLVDVLKWLNTLKKVNLKGQLTELLNGRLKLLVFIDNLHVNMLLLSSLGT